MSRIIFTLIITLAVLTSVAADFYWIGGTGNWNDATKWSNASGGAGGFGVPTNADNVFFDVNSFSASDQTLTINVDAECLNMNWTGVANNPTLAGSTTRKISVYGSLTLVSGMNFNFLGDAYFESNTTGRTITSATQTFKRNVYFNGTGGYILQDAFRQTGSFTVFYVRGTLDFNNQNFDVNVFSSSNTNIRNLSFGSSIITINSTSNSAFIINSTNMTFNAGTSHIFLTGAGGGMNNLTGGGLFFYDLTCTAATGTVDIYNLNGGFNKIVFNSTGTNRLWRSNTVDSIAFNGNGSINDNNNNINKVVFNGSGTINGNGTYGHVIFEGDGTITGNNTFNTLELAPGSSNTFTSARTQLIIDSFIANGTCALPIVLQSSAAGQSNINKNSGTVTFAHAYMRGISSSGGASFTANNTIDLGNNSGWTINAPTSQTLYWVGGTGNWQNASNWSGTSGGSGGACIPKLIDDVVFDANSFSAPGQTVTILGNSDNIAYCRSMTWTGVSNSPTLAGASAQNFHIFGSLTLSPAMNYTFSGEVNFRATTTGHNITTNGKVLTGDVRFSGGGAWTLQDALSIGSNTVFLQLGTLNSNNQQMNMGLFNSNFSGSSRTLNLGSSEIVISSTSNSAMTLHGNGMTINPGTSHIRFTGAGANMSNGSGGGLFFHDVTFGALTGSVNVSNLNGGFNDIVFMSSGNSTISGSNTANSVTFNGTGTINTNNNNFTTVVFEGQGTINGNGTYGHVTMKGNGAITGNNTIGTLVFTQGKQYTLTNARTQTITNNLIANGTDTEQIIIQTTSVGNQSTISKASGTVTVEYVSLRDNNATGGASFIANNSLDLGNNTGWTINAPGGEDYYWVGGTGSWNDAAKWSLSSGGAGGAGIPTLIDNVFFDANSFGAPGQTVTIIGDASNNARVLNMNWTGVTNNPTLAGASSQTLRIHGSLTLSANMTYNFQGEVHFESTETGQTVATAGIVLDKANMHFNGAGGVWTLQDDLNIGARTLHLVRGTLNTNNQNMTMGIFNSNYSGNSRTLNLCSSEIVISSTSNSAMTFNGNGMTLNAGTSLIRFTGNGPGMNNPSGGGLFFHNVVFEGPTGSVSVSNLNGGFNNLEFMSSGSNSISGSNTANLVVFNGNGTISSNNNGFATVIFGSQGTINGNGTYGHITMNGNGSLSGNGTYGHITMNGNGSISGNNTIGTLVFTAGNQYTLTSTRTQIITSDLIANGTETQQIIIQSSSVGNPSTFSKASGTVTLQYVSLRDNTATGGADFIANNSIDMGGNTGWTINAPGGENYYWIGGTGNWDVASNWSLSSGGPPASSLPTLLDNVFFDSNSFSASGQVVTIIGDASNNARVNNMDWTGAAHNPTLAGASNQNLRVHGSLKFIPDMAITFNGTIYFHSTETGKTVELAGKVLSNNDVYFDGAGGAWTLLDDLNIGTRTLYLVRGTLNTNNQNMTMAIFNSNYSGNSRTLNLGSSEIVISSSSNNAMLFHGNGMTLNAGTSLIRFTATGGNLNCNSGGGLFFNDVTFEATTGTTDAYNLNGGFNNLVFNTNGTARVWSGNVINNITFNGTGTGEIRGNNTINNAFFNGNGVITGNNTFGVLEFTPGRTYTIINNIVQTILTDLIALGNCAQLISIESNSATVQTTISKASGSITVAYCNLTRINATGGADFIAENSIDLGGNTGWDFDVVAQNLYWVGGTGNWNDVNHWSASSGGPGGFCVPSQNDNVIFDANSFTQTGEGVFINVSNAECRDMDWSGVAFSPTFTSTSGSNNLRIRGSLTLASAMNFAFSGNVYFEGVTPANITMAGKSFNNTLYFDGVGGEWALQDALTVANNDIQFVRGTLNTNGNTVNVRRFISSNNNTRSLNLGASVFNLSSNNSQAWYVTGNNFNLDAGTSEIRFSAANAGLYSLGSSTLDYNVVVFQNAGGTSTLRSNHTFNSVTINSTGIIRGNGTYGNVVMNAGGELMDNSSYDDVKLYGNTTISGSNSFGRLLLDKGYSFTFQSGQTQTISGRFIIWGSAASPIQIQSSTIGNQATILKPTGTVLGNYIQIRDMAATGGATFDLYSSTDISNNTGWNFLSPTFENLSGITITNGQTECYEATETITLGGSGDFHVQNGGSVTAIAGFSVKMLPGTRIFAGGHLHAYITPFGFFCDTIATMMSSEIIEDMIAMESESTRLSIDFFKVYPNPTSNAFTLELTEVDEGLKITVEIYGIMGERILQNELFGSQRYQFDMSAMPRGVYILRVLRGDQTEIQKIIRQ
jgi:hypothetical protein